MDVLKWARAQWDRVGAWGAVGIGALLLLIGWLGVSRTAYPAEQIPWVVSAGLGGILLVGLGATLWISADLKDEWRKLDRIEEALRGGELVVDGAGSGPNGSAAVPEAEPADETVDDEGEAPPRRRRAAAGRKA